jgi:hypothetical protein
MPDALYLTILLEPHHRRTGNRTGGKIRFVAEVPIVAVEHAALPNESIQTTAERLAGELTSRAMRGEPHQRGEDKMQKSFKAVPRLSKDQIVRQPDAEKDGVRVWLIGADTDS